MRNGLKNIITSRWLRHLFFLALVYFTQVNPFYHVHHFHEDGLLEFEISSHPVEFDVEHSTDHHHHGDRPHTNDHQHTYDNNVDWNIVRQQTPKTDTADDCYCYSSIPLVLTNDNKAFYVDWEEFVLNGEYYVFYDHHSGENYFGAVKSKDLKSWVDVSEKMSFPNGFKHGSIIRVPQGIVDGLVRGVGSDV